MEIETNSTLIYTLINLVKKSNILKSRRNLGLNRQNNINYKFINIPFKIKLVV